MISSSRRREAVVVEALSLLSSDRQELTARALIGCAGADACGPSASVINWLCGRPAVVTHTALLRGTIENRLLIHTSTRCVFLPQRHAQTTTVATRPLFDRERFEQFAAPNSPWPR